MSLDLWRERSKSIPISIPQVGEDIVIGTLQNEYIINVASVSNAIVCGKLVNTPPKEKHYRKGDSIICHVDNILKNDLK